MRPLPQTTVFDRSAARQNGWSDAALSRAARAGRIRRVRHGLFARVGATTDQVAVAAAVASLSGSVASHRSALLLHGLPILGSRPAEPELTVAPTGTGSAHRIHLHRATLFPEDLDLIGDTPTTSVARTLIDVARSRPTVTAVTAVDAALNRRLVTLDQIDDVMTRCWNWPGIARAQRALRLIDGRSESPLESVSRLVMGWLHLPAPDLQVRVLDSSTVVARLDFYWDEYGVAGEADGRSKYTDRDVLTSEKDRQEAIEDLSLPVTRWGWTQVWQQPRAFRARLERAFERGRARDRSGLPRKWSISPAEPIR